MILAVMMIGAGRYDNSSLQSSWYYAIYTQYPAFSKDTKDLWSIVSFMKQTIEEEIFLLTILFYFNKAIINF